MKSIPSRFGNSLELRTISWESAADFDVQPTARTIDQTAIGTREAIGKNSTHPSEEPTHDA
jgi:hypothetical protein